MQGIHTLIKPVSGACNLACRYCFYQDVMDKRHHGNLGFMSDQIRDALIEKAMAEAQYAVSFAFQGGEPTLAGLDFYQAFVEKAERLRRPGMQISYSIQTNGIIVDEKWAEFFRRHHFLVGLSLDGNKEIHDSMRVDPRGKGTFQAVSRTAALLTRTGVDFNILCVVSAATARKARAIYQYLKKSGYRYIQYIPCLDPLDRVHGSQPFSLTPARYESFLKTTFDAWYEDLVRGEYVSIRYFDDLVHILAGKPSSSCALRGECGQYFVIEADGGVYPCDFYVLDEWRMGNIREHDFTQLAGSTVRERFIRRGEKRPDECARCPYRPLCHGGCPRERVWDTPPVRHIYCPALRSFFAYALPRLERIARLERGV